MTEQLNSLKSNATPAAKWREQGLPDPHDNQYNCERAALALGDYTDDELANAVFMHGNGPFDAARATAGQPMPIVLLTAAKERIRWLSRSLINALDVANFQARVQPWLLECFGKMIAGDREERNHRFLEEALELVQSTGCTANEAHQLVDYVFNRPVGEPSQEVGGVMVTLAALCLANNMDMHQAGETELARINQPDMVVKIRAKQAAKPKHSPLPEQPAIVAEAVLENDCMIGQTWFMKGTPVSALIENAESIYKAEAVAQNSKIEFHKDCDDIWFAHEVPFFGTVQLQRFNENGLVEWDIHFNECWQGPFDNRAMAIQHLEECIQEHREEARESGHD